MICTLNPPEWLAPWRGWAGGIAPIAGPSRFALSSWAIRPALAALERAAPEAGSLVVRLEPRGWDTWTWRPGTQASPAT
ncbi:MAG: hypothetical protein KatS3mg060_2300 [Dehalococcoidia bacterium]|nr:MAG: hypothetical protein KatS3mg060_2300 [Dehalococcoidia bacterium]